MACELAPFFVCFFSMGVTHSTPFAMCRLRVMYALYEERSGNGEEGWARGVLPLEREEGVHHAKGLWQGEN